MRKSYKNCGCKASLIVSGMLFSLEKGETRDPVGNGVP